MTEFAASMGGATMVGEPLTNPVSRVSADLLPAFFDEEFPMRKSDFHECEEGEDGDGRAFKELPLLGGLTSRKLELAGGETGMRDVGRRVQKRIEFFVVSRRS